MIAKILLILALLAVMAYSYTQRSRSALVCYSIFLLACLGISCVLFPQVTNRLAGFMGIGRGADLLLYSFIMVALIAILNLHLRIRALQEALTENTRRLALLQAQEEDRI
jgi:small membrane protein